MLLSLYIFIFIFFIGFLIARPHEIIRPSIWVTLSIIVQIGGAAAFSGFDHFGLFQNAQVFASLTILFPLLVLSWALVTPAYSMTAKDLFRRCRATNSYVSPLRHDERLALLFIGTLSICILIYYFFRVPLMSTGLATIIIDPARAAIAREESLKLLEAPLRYSYSFHRAIFAPIVLAILTVWKPAGVWTNISRGFLLIILILSVMLSGSRSTAGNMVLIMSFVYLLKKGLFRGGIMVLAAAFCAVLIITLITIARMGADSAFSMAEIFRLLAGGVAQRVFLVPYETGVWTNLFAQDNGLLGVSNIRPLAALADVQFIDLPNVVGLTYVVNPLDSVSANTCFLFDYQASFGLINGWILSLILLCSLDSCLYAFRPLKGRLLPAIIACFMLALRALSSAAFTTSLLSHGILVFVLIAVGYGCAPKRSIIREGKHPELLNPLRSLHSSLPCKLQIKLSHNRKAFSRAKRHNR